MSAEKKYWERPLQKNPNIELFKDGIDESILEENLKLSYEERILKLQSFNGLMHELALAGRKAREQASDG